MAFMRRTFGRGVAFAFAMHTTFTLRASHAQPRGSDVGGTPARREVTKAPILTTFVEAEYPPEKKAALVEGVVLLTIEIDAEGSVVDVVVARTAAPDFDAAAVTAARQFRFSPTEVDGLPAPVKLTYRYAFVLSRVAPPAKTESERAPNEELEERAREPARVPSAEEKKVATVDTIEIVGRPRSGREANQVTLRAEQARKVAGTQGDVLKVVQNLPGISRPAMASGQIVVWGSAPRDTRIYVDGVDIPSLYHGSGLRSVLQGDLVSSVDLVAGGFGSDYGRGLGGLVRVETRKLSSGTHGLVSADTLDAAALVSTDLSKRARMAVAVRQSWLDRIVAASGVRDVSEVFPIPRYRDGQVKATLDLRGGEALDAVVLGAADDLTRSVVSTDPASTRSEVQKTSFWRAYLRYTRASASDSVEITPFVGIDSRELVQRFGGTPARLTASGPKYGVRASLRSRLAAALSFTTGIDALASLSSLEREGSLTLPPREGDINVFGQPPGSDYTADSWRTSITNVGPYAHADVKFGPVTATPGVRADAFLIEGDRKTPRAGRAPGLGFSRLETAIAPRFKARWEVTPRVSFYATYGTYHQTPEPEDLSAVFGTPDLALERATHVTLGESLHITPTLSADVVAFQKTMRDLVVRSQLTNPRLARALNQNGEGRSHGLQLLLRQEMWHGFFGWVSYAMSRSERRFEGEEAWRAFDFDQPHVVSIVASQTVGKWSFGARFRAASGNPRTPVVGSSYDANADRYDPAFGAQNAIRIPAFWQLDVRVDRLFSLGRGVTMLVFADVQNATHRANAEEIVYSPSFREQRTIQGLPTVAVVGARLEL